MVQKPPGGLDLPQHWVATYLFDLWREGRMILSDIREKLDELLERISKCERKIPEIHSEILRNYQRALYFGFISDVQYNNIKEDLELLERVYRTLDLPQNGSGHSPGVL